MSSFPLQSTETVSRYCGMLVTPRLLDKLEAVREDRRQLKTMETWFGKEVKDIHEGWKLYPLLAIDRDVSRLCHAWETRINIQFPWLVDRATFNRRVQVQAPTVYYGDATITELEAIAELTWRRIAQSNCSACVQTLNLPRQSRCICSDAMRTFVQQCFTIDLRDDASYNHFPPVSSLAMYEQVFIHILCSIFTLLFVHRQLYPQGRDSWSFHWFVKVIAIAKEAMASFTSRECVTLRR